MKHETITSCVIEGLEEPMIKFCVSGATDTVIIDGVEFQFKQVNVRTKLNLVAELSSLNQSNLIILLNEIRELLSSIIVSVKRNENFVNFELAFEEIADFENIKTIMMETIRYCTLTEAQRKNLDSSPEQPTPVSAGNAENNVAPDGEPVLTIPA
jgi:hypothetical protein